MTKEQAIRVLGNLLTANMEESATWLLNYGVDEETIEDLKTNPKLMTEEVAYLVLSNFEINLNKQ